MSQGKFTEAETDFRTLITVEEKVLGPEHPDTLSARSGLANAFRPRANTRKPPLNIAKLSLSKKKSSAASIQTHS